LQQLVTQVVQDGLTSGTPHAVLRLWQFQQLTAGGGVLLSLVMALKSKFALLVPMYGQHIPLIAIVNYLERVWQARMLPVSAHW
jgi:hypothetical protein